MRLPAAPALLLVLTSTAVYADDVTFARGGPSSASAKQAVASAVASSRGDMLPCWRRGASAVDVAVTTDAAGAVTSAAARTDGAAAQCVAGILAVAMMPRSAGAWSGVLTILPPSSGGGGSNNGGGGGNAGDDVNAAIAKHATELRACQKADPKAAGIVEIDLRVHPDGSLTDINVARSLSPALDACLSKLLARTKLDDYHGKEVHYRLGLSYAGGDTGGGYQPPSAPEDAPTRRGPLTVEQMTPVVEGDRREIDACGKGVKATGTLVIRFTIRKDGTVKNLGVKQSIGDSKVEACVLDRFAKLRFPTAGDETQVVFPLSFTAR